jgi:hypothetical protein
MNTSSFAQYPPLAWAKKIEAVSQNSPACSISLNAIDEDGSIYTSGYFDDTLRPDQNQPVNYLIGNSNSPSGAFMKYDVNGNLIWANVLKAKNGSFFVSDLDIDQYHNVYVLCYGVYADTVDFDPGIGEQNQILSGGNDFFIAKYDVNGNFLWTTILNVINGSSFSPLNRPNTIKVDANQNIYIGGQFENMIELNPTNVTYTISNPSGANCNCTAGFYAKYDSIGNILWGYADGNNAGVNDIDVNDANGKIIIGATPDVFTAQTLRLCDAAGNTLNNTSFGNITVNAVKFDTLGNIFFSGHFKDIGNDFDWGPNTFDMSAPLSIQAVGFVGKYDSLANFQWAVQYDPTNDANYRASFYIISMDIDNNLLLAYGEGNGSALKRGFFKIDGNSGFAIWPNSIFSVNVGLGGADLLSSPIDGSVVFAGGAGFSGNTITTFDAAPDPNVDSNLTGRGYWSFMAKYGNCIAAPSAPGVVSGNTSLCNTDSVSYLVPLQNGVSAYNWTLPLGWTGTSNSNTITVLPSNNSGTIEVVANNLCGASAATTLQVNYIGAPNVVANTSATQVCNGDSIVLSGAGADTYVWNNNVVNAQAFVPASTTSYIVTGTLNGCTNADTITVTVNPLPIVSLNLDVLDTLCNDVGIVALVGGIPVGGNYSGPGVNANSFDAQTQGFGIYQIVYNYTDANNCSNSAIDSIYVDVCKGIKESTANANWSIYPNPSENEFTIFTNEINNEIWVTDLLGKIIIQKMHNQTTLNLTIPESGVYIVFLKTDDGISQKKLIVK